MSFLYGIFCGHQQDGDGIILSQNEKWIHQRRFALHVFRNFGMGKNLMEIKITYHTQGLIKNIKRLCTEVNNSLFICIYSILNKQKILKLLSLSNVALLEFKYCRYSFTNCILCWQYHSRSCSW